MNRKLDVITLVLVIVGALNWLLVGLFRFDLVAAIVGLRFGEVNGVSAAIYVLVGISAVYQAAIAWKTRHPAPASQERPTRMVHR